MKAAILFDLDGTLVDSVPDLQAALNRLLGELGRPALHREAVTRMVGDGTARLVERALRATGRMIALEKPLARFLEIYEANASQLSQLYPGVKDVLATLRAQGSVFALCTNKPGQATRAVLDGFGIGEFFLVVVAGDSLPVRKPDPAPLLFALKQLGHEPGQAVMIGDHRNDLDAARAAGIPAIFARYGYARDIEEPVPAAATIDRFTDLPDTLERLRT